MPHLNLYVLQFTVVGYFSHPVDISFKLLVIWLRPGRFPLAESLILSGSDKLEQVIRRWLSPPDPWNNHNLGKHLRPWVLLYGSRETSVNANSLCLFERLKFFVFVAGAGQSVLWYVKIFIFLSGQLIVLTAPQSSGTLMP